jgi:hypothetical protein
LLQFVCTHKGFIKATTFRKRKELDEKNKTESRRTRYGKYLKKGDNNNDVWREVSVDFERQNIKENVREKRSLGLYNELRNNWEKEIYIDVSKHEAWKGTGW